jgi:eukaryotic-like serine/threonine-protein kinase
LALTRGTRLGVYEVTAHIGEGGMGQVYRAHDTKLNRDIALKVLPDSFANDPDRLARFTREAQTLASLNHPNIAHIYGLEESNGIRALVMELVEGEDLAQRLTRGAIAIDEALPIAKQITEALEAAHEQGIIHRDLKPANIKVRTDGAVKVLDFGLAKALDPPASSGDASQSPTITTPAMTQAGMILGTAAYMSPEQAKGRAVDKRSDVWAFGAVLYEMFTGRRAFEGDDVSDTLARILMKEPDWAALSDTVPPAVVAVMRRCLQKDRKQRVRDIGDVSLALEGAFESAATPAPRGRVQVWQQPMAVAALAIVAAISVTLAGWTLRSGTRTDRRPPVRLTVSVPSDDDLDVGASDTPHLALSPDGRVLVYAARRNGVAQLYRRPLDQFSSTPIAGTNGAAMPFFSPDGQWIGFFAGGAMKKVPAGGGEAITVTSSAVAEASWGADDGIVFSPGTFGATLKRTSAAGGDPSLLTTLDASRGDVTHESPDVLPQGTAVLFYALGSGKVLARSLPDGAPKELIEGQWPRYVAGGHLAFVRGTSLWAAPFSADRLEVSGPAVRLAEGILGPPVVAGDGTLAYVSGVPSRAQLVWVTRQGHEDAADLDAVDLSDVALSPDGRRAVITRRTGTGFSDLWIGDLTRRSLTRLTTEGGINVFPLWTQDSDSVVYSSTLGGGRNIFRRPADGSGRPERLTRSANQQSPWTWSKDGRTLVLNELRQTTGYDLVTVPEHGGAESVLLDGPSSDRTPAVSPDGRWIAYQSTEAGTTQVIVRPFPNVKDHRWQVSTDGGAEPKWSPDGRELFYRRGAAVMRVPIGDDPGAARAEKLFEGDYFYSSGSKTWDVAPDGRFLMKKVLRAEYSINVVLNWQDELKRLVPTK